jgi:hypothetical protein
MKPVLRAPLPFPVAERAIQRIWAEGRLLLPAQTASGLTLEVIHPGKWNRLGGPDFLDADISLNGIRRRGDIEFHLNAKDWNHHGHTQDPAYRNVILHAVLFEPMTPILTSDGIEPESLHLLPLLPEDLESIAESDALMEMRGNAPQLTELIRAGNPHLQRDLRRRASERFEAKSQWLTQRRTKLGWHDSLHCAVLECLGQGGNRAPMAELALRHSAESFAMSDAAELYLEQSGRWRLRGLRPAGHPQRRIELYGNLCRHRPQWREHVVRWLTSVPQKDATRRGLIDGIFGAMLPEGLADMVVTDAILPLSEDAQAAHETWLEWPAGLRPDELEDVRQRLGFEGRARNWQIQGILHTLGRGGKG